MKQHAEPRIMPINPGRLRWNEWNLAIFSSHGCSEAPGVQQSWRLRHRSWAIWARGMWLAGSIEDTRWTENPTPNATWRWNVSTEFISSWWFSNWFRFFWVKSDWAQVDSCRVGFNVPEFLDLARWPRKSRLQTVRLGTFLNCPGLHVYRERSCILYLWLYECMYVGRMCVCVCMYVFRLRCHVLSWCPTFQVLPTATHQTSRNCARPFYIHFIMIHQNTYLSWTQFMIL